MAGWILFIAEILALRKGSRSRCGRFNKRVTLANRETPTAGERLQVACVSEKRRGQRQLTLFWTLLVGQPATQKCGDSRRSGKQPLPQYRQIPRDTASARQATHQG